MTIATQSLLFKRENDELPTDTFGRTITDAELTKQRFERIPKKKSSGGVVVKLLACGPSSLASCFNDGHCSMTPGIPEEEVRGSIPGLAATISEIGYLLLSNRNRAER